MKTQIGSAFDTDYNIVITFKEGRPVFAVRNASGGWPVTLVFAGHVDTFETRKEAEEWILHQRAEKA